MRTSASTASAATIAIAFMRSVHDRAEMRRSATGAPCSSEVKRPTNFPFSLCAIFTEKDRVDVVACDHDSFVCSRSADKNSLLLGQTSGASYSIGASGASAFALALHEAIAITHEIHRAARMRDRD